MIQVARRFIIGNYIAKNKLHFIFNSHLLLQQRAFYSSQNNVDQIVVKDTKEGVSPNVIKQQQGEVNDYEQNIQTLKEISKEVFAKIEKYNIKKKYEIFITYSSYRLLDVNTYNIIEKDFIKNLNGFTSEQLINILEGLAKIQMGSQKFQMLIEQYFVKNIHNLNIKECVRLTRILHKVFSFREDSSPTTSKRLCENLHLYFMNKLGEFNSLQKIQMMTGLLQLLKSQRNVYVESLELVFERLSPKISTFTKQETVLFGHLFFSNFLLQREIQLNKREKALDSVNQIMYGRIELTENAQKQSQSKMVNSNQEPNQTQQSDAQEQPERTLFQNKQLFDQKSNFQQIIKSFSASILKNINEFNVKDYTKILEIFDLQTTQLDSSIQQHFDNYVKDNYLDFSPKELYALSSFIDIRYVWMYLDHYKSELEYIDILNFFKTVKMQSSPGYEQALRIIDTRAFQIREKWDLDECVYMLCAREDQHYFFKNDNLFQKEREDFLKEIMNCINKELKIRSRNQFKIYYTIWKLLFRSSLKLDEQYVTGLLWNMRQNISISTFEQYMKIVEILTHVSIIYPQFADEVKQTLVAIEDKYSINIDEQERKKIEQNETKRLSE